MKIKVSFLMALFGVILILPAKSESHKNQPNILWIVSEDNSPYLGCYGDKNAITPNLDRLATEGTLFTHAYANAPVCAPTRSTLITGMYASTTGTHNMRSFYTLPEYIKSYSQHLMEHGYYCTNNDKKDYNSSMIDRPIWNESSNKATYKNKKEDQPFFAIFNLNQTHEGKVHRNQSDPLIHNPEDMEIPPYHPDLPEVRHDWAQFYDVITKMDGAVGDILKELDESGYAENTIVFYYGDHGGIIPRSKRFLYNTGTQVPFIVRFPENYKYLASTKPGKKDKRMVSFIDFGPTVLSLAGIETPDYMEGKPFLGKFNTEKTDDYVFFFRGRMDERHDYMLAVCNERYRLIYNFYPERPCGQHLSYLWRANTAKVWEQAYKNGECNATQSLFWQPKPVIELYDMLKDPWEVKNLAENKKYEKIQTDLLSKLKEHVINSKDASLMPESELIRINEQGTIYEFAKSDEYPIKELVEVAFKSATSDNVNYNLFQNKLKSSNASVRYWSLCGLTRIALQNPVFKGQLKSLLNDECPNVGILAARTLYQLGEKEAASKIITKYLRHEDLMIKLIAINAIQLMGDEAFLAFEDELDVIDKNNVRTDGVQRTIYIADIIREGKKRVNRN